MRFSVVFLTGFLCAIAGAQEPSRAPDWPAVETAFDAYFADHLPKYHVPGGVLVIVHGEQVRFAKGYGYANIESEIPVVADETLFRIGSVSKLLTGTAAMQCVERGLLDLHRDVNEYLEAFQVPGAYPEPVTLHHLLAHTAGFDDRFLALGAMDTAGIESLGEYLARRLPPRVQPPGEIMNYSNFGIVLAAHLVELVTGKTFDQYVDEEICEPLGMSPGGFDQPLPPELAARLARSYVPAGETFSLANWQDAASQVWPAGAYAVTATDMAKFMIAHLNQGRYGDAQILTPETARTMHARQFINHPGLTRGQCYVFHERFKNGRRVIWHTGRVNRFTAQLVLVPELDLGFFAAFNSDEGDQTRKDLFDLFAKQFFPKPETLEFPTGELAPPDPAVPYAGTYRQVRRVRSSFLKVAFFGQDVLIGADSNGHLHHSRILREGATAWLPLGKDIFRAAHTDDNRDPQRMAFVRDDAGTIKYACIEEDKFTAVDAFARIAWYETSLFHAVLLGVGYLLLLSMLVRAPLALRGFRERMYLERVCAVLGAFAAACLVLFAAGLGTTIATIDPYRFAFGLPPVVLVLLALPLLAVPCACGLALAAVALWRQKAVSRSGRLHYLAVSAAALAVVWSLHYWNLLGYKM
ncbi:MAG: serine hydrolase domain-containing protein [Candidatus Hydrogenedentota bacterium]